MTYNQATKYFSCLRKWTKASTFLVIVQVKNMTKVHSKVMHRIRRIFMANKLQAIENICSTSNYKLAKYTDDGGILHTSSAK